jgi:hypothetical protein
MNGTLYVGDGSWGVSPRIPVQRWYDQVIKSDKYVFEASLFLFLVSLNSHERGFL